MYTRNVRIKLRANSATEFRLLLKERIIPLLRTQKGFQDQITLVTSQRNEAVAIIVWDNDENTAAYHHVAYLDFLRTLSTVTDSDPLVESFELIDATSEGALPGLIFG